MWNDNEDEAARWERNIKSAGFNKVKRSSEQDSERFGVEFKEYNPDMLILDILRGDEQTLGLDFTKVIRRYDKLVPIVAVTREPVTVPRRPVAVTRAFSIIV